MVRVTKCKHICDRCSCNTLINSEVRKIWFDFKNESLCAKCFDGISDKDKKDAEAMYDLILSISANDLLYCISGGSQGLKEYVFTDEDGNNKRYEYI
jgi:hypothetical protein